MGLKMQPTKLKVFRNMKEGPNGPFATFSTSWGDKDAQGNWLNGCLELRFPRGTEPQQFQQMQAQNGRMYEAADIYAAEWEQKLRAYTDNEGNQRTLPYAMVWAWSQPVQAGQFAPNKPRSNGQFTTGNGQGAQQAPTPVATGFEALTDDEIPF